MTRNERGAVFVELAIVISVLALFILGMTMATQIARAQHAVAIAAREGARYGAITRDVDAIVSRAKELVDAHGYTGVVKVEIRGAITGSTTSGGETTGGTLNPGGVVNVTVTTGITVAGIGRVVTVTGEHSERTPSHDAGD